MSDTTTGGALGGLIGMGLDYATAGWQDKRAKKMAKFNQELAIDTWNKTNMEAQRKHMEAAGLNVGLMYQGKGGGGTTSQAAQVAPVGGGAGMGMQMGMQMQMQKAQIENIKADTSKKKAEEKKLGGPDTEAVLAGIEQMKQATTNAKVQEEIMRYEKEIKAIEANVAGKTQEDVIKQVNAQYQLLQQQIQLNDGQNPELIKQAKQTTLEQAIRMDLIRANVIKTGVETEAQRAAIQKTAAEIIRMSEQTAQGWKAVSQKDQEQVFQMLETEHKYGNKWDFKVFMDNVEKIIPF